MSGVDNARRNRKVDVEITTSKIKEVSLEQCELDNGDFMKGYRTALRHSGHRLDAIDGKLYMGSCEACSRELMEDDEYTTDEEGVYLCEECSDEFRGYYET